MQWPPRMVVYLRDFLAFFLLGLPKIGPPTRNEAKPVRRILRARGGERASSCILGSARTAMGHEDVAAAVVDDLGAETAAAREAAAADSKARKAAEAERLAADNAEQRRRLANVGAREDDDIMDEAAGRARLEMAAASKARRAEEARQLAAENAERRGRLASVGAKEDDDIMDEAAGRARLEMAAASKARKAEEARQLAAENDERRERLARTGARIDDDISDEAAGARRRELAAEASARRAAEAEEARVRNAELKARLSAVKSRTDDGDGGGVLPPPVMGLVPMERASKTTTSTFLRFQVAQEAHEVAEVCRQEAQVRFQTRDAAADAWAAGGRAHLNSARQRRERLRKLGRRMQHERRQTVVTCKAAEAERGGERMAQKERLQAEVSTRVLEARSLDSRLDAAERATDAAEAAEGVRLKASLADAVARVRQQRLEHHKALFDTIEEGKQLAQQARRAAFDAVHDVADAKRGATKALAERRDLSEEEYLKVARANRQRALDFRERARRSREASLSERKASAKKERDNDHLVTSAKQRSLRSARREAAAVYKTRFVSEEEEASWMASPLHKLHQRVTSSARRSHASSRASSVVL